MIPRSVTAPISILVVVSACSSEGITPAALPSVGIWNQGANLRDSVNNQTHGTGEQSFVWQGDWLANRER